MIHFDDLDCSECCSEEVISLFWCSVDYPPCIVPWRGLEATGQVHSLFTPETCFISGQENDSTLNQHILVALFLEL